MSAFITEGYPVCANPVAVQCRRTKDRVPSFATGEFYSCEPDKGGVCINDWQGDTICDDYEVRFYCPN